MDEILNERARTHGDFSEVAITAQLFKNNATMRLKQNETALNDTQCEALDMIFTKIVRIICGDSNEKDHWRDIAGYALLVVKELDREREMKNYEGLNVNKICPTEKAEHLKLISWLNLKHLKFNHTANERKTTLRQGAELKRLGVKKGFPDISVYLGNKVLFIELKRAVKSKSVVSKEQNEWIEFLNALPYAKAKICYGANEAIEFINENL